MGGALLSLLENDGFALSSKDVQSAPKAKSVVHLFMNGGPSQVDTFNYCPELARYASR